MKNKIRYTVREKTVKNSTVGQAAEIASMLLSKRYGLCINAISGRELSEKITLVELNDLVEQLLVDSRFYAI